MKTTIISTLVLLFACAFWSCGIDVPLDPSSAAANLTGAARNISDTIQDTLSDPLGAKPFPKLMGGDGGTVYYAANLTEVKLNFPGPTNDILVPGVVGPTNIYAFTQRPRENTLIRPLLPSGTFYGLATDGRFVAYDTTDELGDTERVIRAVDLSTETARALFTETAGERVLELDTLQVSDGRAAYLMYDLTTGIDSLRVHDLLESPPTSPFEIIAQRIGDFDLRGNKLAYFLQQEDSNVVQLWLYDLDAKEQTVIVSGLRASSVNEVGPVFVTDGRVVWQETSTSGAAEIFAWDMSAQTTTKLVDDALGTLAGATDDRFLTEEYIDRGLSKKNRIAVYRYDENGRSRRLARFAADGGAGQAQVIGDRAAWVKPDRQVVLAPMAGGDRTTFRPR